MPSFESKSNIEGSGGVPMRLFLVEREDGKGGQIMVVADSEDQAIEKWIAHKRAWDDLPELEEGTTYIDMVNVAEFGRCGEGLYQSPWFY